MKSKELLAIALCATVGGAIGYTDAHGDQSHARDRVITVDTCRKIYPDEAATIGHQLLSCLEDGVPGGAKTKTHLEVGDSEVLLDAYRQKQVNEANNFNTGKVVSDAAIGGVIGLVIG